MTTTRLIPTTALAARYWWLGPLVLAEALLVVAYFGATAARPTDPRYVVYPFVWMNVGLLAVAGTRPRTAGRRQRVAAAGVAVAYFLVLAWLAGLLALDPSPATHSHVHPHGWQVTLSAPGWGPRVGYATAVGHAYFVPFRVVGYGALAYLLFARTLDASTAALSGVVGLATCLSCGVPVVASLVAGTLGPAAAGPPLTSPLAFDLSTVAFLLTVGALYWSPRLASLGGADR